MSTSLRFVMGLLCVSMAMTTRAELSASHDVAAAQGDRERFVGAWRLAWLEEPAPDGKICTDRIARDSSCSRAMATRPCR
jgi:hypothetical protein